ncbi:helix-turn-helix domain-containing protein [Jatrophihabitans sp. DSM 45814]
MTEQSGRRGAEVKIGSKLRAARMSRGLTIEKLAHATGLTKGFISRMERDEVSASVASLVAICDELGIRVGQLFDAPETTVIRANEGKPINFGGEGVREHLLTPGTERKLQIIHSLIEAGGGGGGAQLYSLDTDVEFVHVLAGKLDVLLASQTITLFTGDSFTFPGRELHSWRNASKTEPAEILWVLTPSP